MLNTLTPYERRVRELEAEGLTRSDAQGVADAEGLDDFQEPERDNAGLTTLLEEADKVVIGGNWWAMVDGRVYCGAMLEGGTIDLTDEGAICEYDHRALDEGQKEIWARATAMLHADALLAAARRLVSSFQTGAHYNTQNPYTRPEVRTALEAIKAATGFPGDWMDANNEGAR